MVASLPDGKCGNQRTQSHEKGTPVEHQKKEQKPAKKEGIEVQCHALLHRRVRKSGRSLNERHKGKGRQDYRCVS